MWGVSCTFVTLFIRRMDMCCVGFFFQKSQKKCSNVSLISNKDGVEQTNLGVNVQPARARDKMAVDAQVVPAKTQEAR